MAARRTGRTRPWGGHDGRRSPVSRTPTGSMDARSPSGRASGPDARMTSEMTTAVEAISRFRRGTVRRQLSVGHPPCDPHRVTFRPPDRGEKDNKHDKPRRGRPSSDRLVAVDGDDPSQAPAKLSSKRY